MISPLVLTSALLSQTPAPARGTSEPPQIGVRAQTDQTVPVTKGTRVDLNSCAGEVSVKTWDRDAVRVQATHSRRTRVRAEARGQVLLIDADGSVGRGTADFELTVPVWINLHVEGHDCFIEIDGVTGSVSAETAEGDVILRNLGGNILARAIEGSISLEGSRGRAELSTVEGDITITKSQGEISAESVDGSISIDNSQAAALEVSTVDGDISYTGSFQPSGRYLLTTHDGDIQLVLPDNTSATFGIRTQGDRVESTLPLKQAAAASRGRRTIYTIGSGSAQVELQCFDGTVRIRRVGEVQKD